MEACNGQILTQANLTYCEQVLICKGMHLFTNIHVNEGEKAFKLFEYLASLLWYKTKGR